MNMRMLVLGCLCVVGIVANGRTASNEASRFSQKLLLANEDQTISTRSLLKKIEAAYGIQWVAAGGFASVLDKKIASPKSDVLVKEVLEDVARQEATSVFITNGVVWYGDEKKYIKVNDEDLPGTLSILVDAYTVTLLAQGGRDQRLSIEGEYYCREILGLVASRFGLCPRYFGGAIHLVREKGSDLDALKTAPRGGEAGMFPP